MVNWPPGAGSNADGKQKHSMNGKGLTIWDPSWTSFSFVTFVTSLVCSQGAPERRDAAASERIETPHTGLPWPFC